MKKKRGIRTEIKEIIEPLLEERGYELIEVEYVKEGPRRVLRLYIDHPSGIGLDDCEKVSSFVSDILDERDPIEQSYFLEVSSPGANRPLRKASDYNRFKGREIVIKTFMPVNGQKKFKGTIKGLKDDHVLIEIEKDQEITLPLKNIASARLEIKF